MEQFVGVVQHFDNGFLAVVCGVFCFANWLIMM